jgi:PAS domain S-box-containing protein
VADETAPNPALNDQLLDASPDGVLAFDRECRYTAWNRAMERISGLRREQVLGRVAFEVFPFLTETGEDRCFREALAGRDAVSEARPYVIPESGRRGFFDAQYSPLRDGRGEVVGGVGIIRDVTAREEAEDALRQSEERYRAFIANSSEGIWRVELERPVPTDLPADQQIELFYRHAYLAECNDAMARMYGYERAGEIAGARLGDLLVRSDPANVEYLRAFVAAGYRLAEVESVERDREGNEKYFSNSLVGVVERGAVLRAWGTQRDVTERRRIEEALKATEHRFLMFMEHLPGLAWIKDADGRYLYVNEAAARAFRAPRAEIPGKTDEELFPPETAAQFRENDRAALTGGEVVVTVETLEQEDGPHQSIVSKFPIPGRSGEAASVGGVAIDVTERMRAEEALRRSEERYRSLLENANDIIYSHDFQGNYLAINKACEKITGYTREEILNGLNMSQVVAPDHMERARRMMEQKLRDPSPTVYEIDIITKDRRRLTLEVSTRISYLDGQPVAVEGIARDVTERRRAEEERRQLLAREQQARREAEEALQARESVERSLTLLVEASRLILGSPSLAAVQPAVLDLSRRLVEADAYAIWRLDPRARVWRIVSSAGLSRDYSEDTIPAPDDSRGVLERPVVAEDVTKLPLLAERGRMYETEGIRSLLAAPLRIHGEPCGTLVFYYRRPHKFRETELTVVAALANLAGAAISNAELYEEQHALRAAAQVAEQRATFLAEAGRVLSSSLDYQKTLSEVARLAVPDLADWCAVDLVGEGGAVERLAVAHVDPTKVEWAQELQRRYPPDPDAPHGLPNVLRTGRSEIYPEITDEMLVAGAHDEEHLKVLCDLRFSSAMIVPLAAHGRTLGAVTFVAAESGRRYGPEDLRLCEALSLRAAAAIENARLYHAAREASRLKDEFLATVSHELRTPLTAIVGWMQLLRAKQVDAETAERALDTVERNARSQAQLINDLLDVSRIVTGKLHLDARPLAVGAVVDGAITSVRPAADAKRIEIRAALDPGLPEVHGDRDRLQQVFWNLLSNAVKFTPEGGRIGVAVRARGASVEIEVSDTGQGIPEKFLPHVFDRFRQADQSTTRAYGGLGLGLSIVRHLVELHGGTVRADSEGEGRGATFAVTLPVVRAPRGGGPDATALPPAGFEPAPNGNAIRLDGLKVLVVDDEEDTRELLAFGLSSCGARVSSAASADAALKALAEELPEVLISDIGMPGADGYELIRRVRSLPAGRGGETPAVALTAYARTEDRQRALKAGYQLHVAKPVAMDELVAAVSSLARRVS